MCEGSEGHMSLKFPWMNQSAGEKDMLMFNAKICTVLKLLPGTLLQRKQLWGVRQSPLQVHLSCPADTTKF